MTGKMIQFSDRINEYLAFYSGFARKITVLRGILHIGCGNLRSGLVQKSGTSQSAVMSPHYRNDQGSDAHVLQIPK